MTDMQIEDHSIQLGQHTIIAIVLLFDNTLSLFGWKKTIFCVAVFIYLSNRGVSTFNEAQPFPTVLTLHHSVTEEAHDLDRKD